MALVYKTSGFGPQPSKKDHEVDRGIMARLCVAHNISIDYDICMICMDRDNVLLVWIIGYVWYVVFGELTKLCAYDFHFWFQVLQFQMKKLGAIAVPTPVFSIIYDLGGSDSDKCFI